MDSFFKKSSNMMLKNKSKNDLNEVEQQKILRKDKIKFILNDVQSESMRACIKIFQTPHIIISLFLFVFILLSSGLAGFLVIQTILRYFNFEVTTTTRTIYELSSPFPKITICNVNPFTTNNSIEFLREINEQKRPDIDMFNQTELDWLNYTQKTALFTDVYMAANIAMTNLSDYKKKLLSHSIDDILISCQFNGEVCNASDFIWKFDKFFGSCFVFNSGFNSNNEKVEYKKSNMPGSLFGLNLQFYINFHENLTLFNSYNYNGAYVRIENASFLSDDLLDNGIYISPGKWTNALVKRVVGYVLPKPYSACELENESTLSDIESKSTNTFLLSLFYNSLYQYTQQTCIIQCLQYQSLQECNCTYPLYLSLFNREPCITSSQLECYSNVWSTFLKKNYAHEKCLPLCPLECNRTSFVYHLTEVDLFGDHLIDFIEENENLRNDFLSPIDREKAKKSVVRLSIFSETLSYSLSTEAPAMDLVSLFASMGGNLGLFLNISFFSFGEFCVLFIEIFYVFKKQRIVDLN